MLEPERALETSVNEAAMHADRMSEAERDTARHDKKKQCIPGKIKRPKQDGRERHRSDPQRFSRGPFDAAGHRIGIVSDKNAFGSWSQRYGERPPPVPCGPSSPPHDADHPMKAATGGQA